MPNIVHLKNRRLISISKKDRFHFLQGLITNDINKLEKEISVYSLMLNPQGRFLYEFFLTKHDESIIIETCQEFADSLIKKLKLYQLRSEVDINLIDDLEVFFLDNLDSINKKTNNDIVFIDPRNVNFGQRIYAKKDFIIESDLVNKDLNYYNYLRISSKITDESDLIHDKSIISEYNFDDLNAISYEKGCYVGQEVIARNHFRGEKRKKVFLINIDNLDKIEKLSEVVYLEKKIGIILSSVFYNKKLYALALIKNVDYASKDIDLESLNLTSNGQQITILK